MESSINSNLKIFLGYFTLHDFFFFSTRDYNTYGIVEDIISNYALMYALNGKVSEIHRAYSQTIPFYDQDYEKFEIYSTPAYFFDEFKQCIDQKNISSNKLSLLKGKMALIKGILEKWDSPKKISFNYNAVGELASFAMEQEKLKKLNYPKIGAYEKIPPLNSFVSFIVSKMEKPSLFRLGKKSILCRAKYFKLNNLKVKKGIFKPDHPVNSKEIEHNAEFINGSAIIIRPTPILKNCTLKGTYIEAELEQTKFTIFYPLLKNNQLNI